MYTLIYLFFNALINKLDRVKANHPAIKTEDKIGTVLCDEWAKLKPDQKAVSTNRLFLIDQQFYYY